MTRKKFSEYPLDGKYFKSTEGFMPHNSYCDTGCGDVVGKEAISIHRKNYPDHKLLDHTKPKTVEKSERSSGRGKNREENSETN